MIWLSGTSGEAHSLQEEMRALDASVIAESELHRDVLSARAGMLHNYDPLVREDRDLRAARWYAPLMVVGYGFSLGTLAWVGIPATVQFWTIVVHRLDGSQPSWL